MDRVCLDCGNPFIRVASKSLYCIDCTFIRKQPKGFKPRSSVYAPVREKPRPLYNFKEYNLLVRRRYSWIKISARRRGIEFQLSIQYLAEIMSMPCYYCKATRYKFSVDRKDNHGGYFDENVVACCRSCNSRKQQTPANLFIQ